MLETRGLTKRFGRGDQAQDAVADVSLHIREGEVYGLLGPNGAGKSTTLKMICGMLRPTAGEILFAGHAWRREDLYAIGSLIEEAPLYPNLTARENLRVRTTLLGLPEMCFVKQIFRKSSSNSFGSQHERSSDFTKGCGTYPSFLFPSMSESVTRRLSPLNSTSLPWWTILSTSADASLSSANTVPHFPNSMLVVSTIDWRS